MVYSILKYINYPTRVHYTFTDTFSAAAKYFQTAARLSFFSVRPRAQTPLAAVAALCRSDVADVALVKVVRRVLKLPHVCALMLQAQRSRGNSLGPGKHASVVAAYALLLPIDFACCWEQPLLAGPRRDMPLLLELEQARRFSCAALLLLCCRCRFTCVRRRRHNVVICSWVLVAKP